MLRRRSVSTAAWRLARAPAPLQMMHSTQILPFGRVWPIRPCCGARGNGNKDDDGEGNRRIVTSAGEGEEEVHGRPPMAAGSVDGCAKRR